MQRTLVLIATVLFGLACDRPAPADPEAGGGVEVGPSSAGDEEAGEGDSQAGPVVVAQPSGEEEAEPPMARGPELPTGALCDSSADCGEGEVCEGVGCEAGQGRCAPSERMCTRDLADYCGCDGKSFQSSGSCAGARYAYRGTCDAQLEDGESCTDGRQCRSGQCVGEGLEGCGRSAGVCGTQDCTQDLMAYCGCNGTQFSTSGSCPNRQFAYRGACEAAG